MSKHIPLFEYPEFNETFNDLLDKILNESGRGAILIGTSYVEQHLEKFITKILPENGKRYTSRLLNYPGPLSSFSSKLELSYAFRLISKRTYDSLNALRKIRNYAAHSSNEFDLGKIEINKIFNLGEGFFTVVQESSAKMLISFKIDLFKYHLQENDFNNEDIEKIIKEKFQEEKTLEILGDQLPHWQLIIGLSMICGLLRFHADETLTKIGGYKTWSSIK